LGAGGRKRDRIRGTAAQWARRRQREKRGFLKAEVGRTSPKWERGSGGQEGGVFTHDERIDRRPTEGKTQAAKGWGEKRGFSKRGGKAELDEEQERTPAPVGRNRQEDKRPSDLRGN